MRAVCSYRGPTRRSVGSVRMSQSVLGNPTPGAGNQQWSPDFPAASHSPVEKTHSKFVPMQFRTQPANLPGGIRRQSTHANMAAAAAGDARGQGHVNINAPVSCIMHTLFVYISDFLLFNRFLLMFYF